MNLLQLNMNFRIAIHGMVFYPKADTRGDLTRLEKIYILCLLPYFLAYMLLKKVLIHCWDCKSHCFIGL